MKKIVTFEESELINMVKTIAEQVNQDLSRYDDNDFSDAFFFIFRNWLGNKIGEDVKKYPFSYLLKKFGQEFLKETFGDKFEKYFSVSQYGEPSFSRSEIPRIGKKLIQVGAHTLPSLRQEEKFTELYSKHIARLVKMLNLPSYARLELIEPTPQEVNANLYIDYPSFLKSTEPTINEYNIEKKFKSLLEDYLGVEFGSPVHGEISLSFSLMLENEDKWVKNVLNKEIKKHIKQMTDGNQVHSIRFEPKTSRASLRIVYKEGSSRRMHQFEFRNKVSEYLKGLGYTKIDVENV